jgi:hypothetical protein
MTLEEIFQRLEDSNNARLKIILSGCVYYFNLEHFGSCYPVGHFINPAALQGPYTLTELIDKLEACINACQNI